MTKSATMSSTSRAARALAGLLVAAFLLSAGTARAWQFTLFSSANPTADESARDVAVMPTSRSVVAAGAWNPFQGNRYSVVRLEPGHGNQMWTYFGFPSHGEARAVAATDDLIVSAGVANEGDDGNDFTVMSHQLEFGFPLWDTRISSDAVTCNDHANAVAIDADGDVIAAGALGDPDFGTAFTVVKLGGTFGNELWRAVIPNGEALALTLDGGDPVVAGVIGGQFTVVRLDAADGSETWRTTLGNGRAVAVGTDGDGGLYAAGSSDEDCSGQPCGVFSLSSGDGHEFWRAPFYDAPTSSSGTPSALVVGRGAGVIVAGTEHQGSFDVLSTVRYDGGNVTWRYVLEGNDGNARGADVALADDAAVVTGLFSGGNETSMAVARLDIDEGDELWLALRSGGGDTRNEGLAVAVDGDDNVVAGGVLTAFGQEEFGVVKIEGATGQDYQALCGNGTIDAGEDCDDFNNDDGDCCSATCTFEDQGATCSSDGNECTDDVCDGEGLCEHNDNTSDCDDNDDCTEDDVCSGGQCTGQLAPAGTECNTFNQCTDGACNANGECVATPNTNQCNDGNACTNNDHCSNGACGGQPLSGTQCDDFNPCTDTGICQAGHCAAGTPAPEGKSCFSDGNDCTDDVCNATGQCVHPPNDVACDDGDACTPGGACVNGACQIGATTSTTTTTTTSTSTSSTSSTSTTLLVSTTSTSTTTSTTSTTSTTVPQSCTEDATCDDGDVCNGEEACEGGFCGPPAQSICRRGAPEAYVSAFRADAVAVVDVGERTVETTIPVPGSPWGIVWRPDGSRVYVTSRRGNSVSAIDTATRTVIATAPVGTEPLGIAIDPSGARLWVANHGSDTVSVLDADTLALLDTVKTGHGPAGVAMHPAGTRVYVSNYRNATLSVIDAASATVTATVPVDDLPLGVAVHPAGTKVYVTSYRARNVDVVGTTSATVLSKVRVGRKPVGVAFDGSGARAFVASSGDDVLVVLDTASDAVTSKVPVGKLPLGVAVDLASDQPWVTQADSDTIGILGETVEDVSMPRTPVAFGAFIGTPSGRCPARAPRCDDADPFTQDGCGRTSGCAHTDLVGLDGVAAGVHALVETLATAPIGDGPLAARLRTEVPALDGVIAAVQAGEDRSAGRVAKRRLTAVVRLLERARRRGELGPDGGRLLDLARETRRRLKLALRGR